MIGTGEKIDKYRHLLRSCLPPEDQEMLDENLEDMIRMMEDEAEVGMENGNGSNGAGLGAGAGDPMEIAPV